MSNWIGLGVVSFIFLVNLTTAFAVEKNCATCPQKLDSSQVTTPLQSVDLSQIHKVHKAMRKSVSAADLAARFGGADRNTSLHWLQNSGKKWKCVAHSTFFEKMVQDKKDKSEKRSFEMAFETKTLEGDLVPTTRNKTDATYMPLVVSKAPDGFKGERAIASLTNGAAVTVIRRLEHGNGLIAEVSVNTKDIPLSLKPNKAASELGPQERTVLYYAICNGKGQ